MVEKTKFYNILLLALIGAATATAPLPADAETLRGTATVIDGQTLEIQGRRFALAGVLAPPLAMACTTKREKSYPCGELARQALADIVGGNQIVCTVAASPQPGGPTEALCQIGPFSLNEMMIASGRVLARPGVSERYQKAARSARLLGEGLWKGGFPPPETWRPSR